MTSIEWRAVRQPAGTVDTDLFDVAPLKETVNRFANSSTLHFDDPTGAKKSDYPRGQRVDLEYSTDDGSTWTRRWAGFVQDRAEETTGTADTLRIQLVGYDLFLRVQGVYTSYPSMLLSDIIEDLIQTYTPVTYVAGNVTVQNDRTVTYDFGGEKVDEALAQIAAASAGEDYYVNDDFEFVFEQRETEESPVNITDGDWFRYDLPERGADSVNRVELFYGEGGNESRVIVEDRADQRDLRDKLNAAGNVVIAEEQTFPSISNEAAARDRAEEILNRKSTVQTGTVTTFGRYAMSAGDVFRLEIGEKGIDTDFRVAQIEYYWLKDETRVTVVENQGDVQQLLVEIADTVRRVSARDADPDAAFTEFLDLGSGVDVTVDARGIERPYRSDSFTFGVGGDQLGHQQSAQPQLGHGYTDRIETFTQSAVATNVLLNAIRDGWQGDSQPALSHLGVGTALGTPTRTQNSLGAEVTREPIETLVAADATSIKATAGIDATTTADVNEVGLFNAATGNEMFARAVITATDLDADSNTDVLMTVGIDDASDLFGVITTAGQTAIRDILLGVSGTEPTDMVYGTGSADATVGDTALDMFLREDAIESTADGSIGITDVVQRLGTGEANGNSIAELGQRDSGDALLSRIVIDAIAKTSDFELETNHQLQAKNG